LSKSSAWELVAYVILPYIALAVFVLGHVWRYRFDRFGWTSRSSQLYERRWLLVGAPLFHYGALLAILGHAIGLLLPKSATEAMGIPEWLYHGFSKVAGTTAAILIILGLTVLTLRRMGNDRVRGVTGVVDWIALGLLWVMIALGFGVTVIYNVLGPDYNYRETVSVWMRGIFTFRPDIADISVAPLIYRVHAIVAWVFLALFPFTRFVHFWSVPVWYLTRPFVLYRRRVRPRALSPGESRAWRRFGRDSTGPTM
jgi:nitrate reductase gamma subunit